MRKWFSCKGVLENTYITQHHIKILKMRIFNKRITTNIEQLLVTGMALPPIGGGEQPPPAFPHPTGDLHVARQLPS